MKMKVIITSPDALFNVSTQEFFPNIIRVLRCLEKNAVIEGTIVVSSHQRKLEHIPSDLHPLHVDGNAKRGKDFIDILISNVPEIKNYNDLIVLGANDSDFFMSTNSKLLLFSALYATSNNPNSRVFDSKYGIQINHPIELVKLLQRFGNVNDSLYYQLDVSKTTSIFSLISSNSKISTDEDLNNLKKKLAVFLKNHVATHSELFYNFFIFSLYFKIPELREVNYWGVYPSSRTGEFNDEISKLKESIRVLFKSSRIQDPILIRGKTARKRAYMDRKQRFQDACANQLDTIYINPKYKDKLEGSTICILDDFTTYGSSCETARALLESVGVKRLYFITIGKFGFDYIMYRYHVDGNKYQQGGFSYQLIRSGESLDGQFNKHSDVELKKILGDIL